MAAFRQIATQLKPMLAGTLPGLRMERSFLFFTPVGYYLRGCRFISSKWGGDVFYATEVCAPLYSSTSPFIWGDRLRTPAGADRWQANDHESIEALAELVISRLAPNVGRVVDGPSLANYVNSYLGPTFGITPPIALGCAALHSGNLVEAKQILADVVQSTKAQAAVDDPFIVKLFEKEPFKNIQRLLSLMEENPDAIPRYCQLTAQQALIGLKLAKYWSEDEFWPR